MLFYMLVEKSNAKKKKVCYFCCFQVCAQGCCCWYFVLVMGVYYCVYIAVDFMLLFVLFSFGGVEWSGYNNGI